MMLVIFYRFCLVTQSEFLMLCYSNDTGLSNVRSKMPTVELKQSEWLMKERRGERKLHQHTARPGQVERRSLARPTLSF